MASIQKRPDGRWRARYRDETGKEHARHFPRKIDAQKWLNEITASVVTGRYVDPKAGTVTFEGFYADWSQRQIWTQGTTRGSDLAVRSTTFAGLELRRIKRSHLEQWVKSMSDAGLAPQTIHTRVMAVRNVLRAAVRDRLIAHDPADGIVLPRRRRVEHSMAIPSPEDVGRLYAASEPWYQAFIGLCAFAGLRLGEAAAVNVNDIDFLRRTLSVQRQVQKEPNKELEIRAPKYGSERTVYLPDQLLMILSRHISDIGVYGDKQWLFIGEGGMPPKPRRMSYTWDRLVAVAGVPKTNLHSLRHFYASGLIASGCDVVTVQRAMGHSSATTTLNTYSHLWPDAADRTRNAAGSLVDSALGASADSLRTVATAKTSD